MILVSNKEMEIKRLKNSIWKFLKCKEDVRVYIRKIFLMEFMFKNGRGIILMN